jgi:hypothetical protein
MNLNDNVVYRWLRLGSLRQRNPGHASGPIRHHNRLHNGFLLGHLAEFRIRHRTLGGFF